MTEARFGQAHTAPPWSWPPARYRETVLPVRAGRTVSGDWPGGARVAVALSVDVDHETPWLRDGETTPDGLAYGEYGARRGLPRLLALFERVSAPATVFVPAVSALLHPESVIAAAAAGHEIAAHGWVHERVELLTRDQEQALLEQSLDALERLTGQRPVGQRTPSFGCSAHTLTLAHEAGLLYDSSLMADDDPYELLLDGTPTGMLEIPVDWARDDAAFLITDRYGGLRPIPDPTVLTRAWAEDYQQARDERGVFQLTLHPDLSGRRGPLRALGRLLESIAADTDAWFATHAQLARHCLGKVLT